ncbi:hypothetical protein JOD54_002046 [Actinokineospora baliensis]|uniref:hypothetical protein n=1 Tax=Actinokineospora baliensis TaxID=547056 RepID=UPI0019561A5B|nr:hypothetical protein [Actinokineospora baliensis]MBM7771842.1 hypothetical protein [Actinokineospora baliensis]
MAVIPAHAKALLEIGTRHWTATGAVSLSGAPVRTLVGGPLDAPQVTVNPYWDLALAAPVHERPLPVPGSGVLVEVLPPPHGPFGWWVPQRRLAWSLPSPGDLTWLLEHLAGRPVLDLGAGLGYWAWQLAQLDVDVLAVDAGGQASTAWLDGVAPFHPVHPGTATTAAAHGDRALFLSWPPPGGLTTAALAAYPGDTVIYAGEQNPEVCGDREFFTELTERWTPLGHSPFHTNLYGARSVLTAYRRAS